MDTAILGLYGIQGLGLREMQGQVVICSKRIRGKAPLFFLEALIPMNHSMRECDFQKLQPQHRDFLLS